MQDIKDATQAKLKDHMQQTQNEALKQWNAKARAWNGQSKHLCQYLKNVKAIIQNDQECTSSPQQIHALLNEYWSAIENWQHPQHEQQTWDILDDHYSIYLPSVLAQVVVDAKSLQRQAKMMKVTAPGLDA